MNIQYSNLRSWQEEELPIIIKILLTMITLKIHRNPGFAQGFVFSTAPSDWLRVQDRLQAERCMFKVLLHNRRIIGCWHWAEPILARCAGYSASVVNQFRIQTSVLELQCMSQFSLLDVGT